MCDMSLFYKSCTNNSVVKTYKESKHKWNESRGTGF